MSVVDRILDRLAKVRSTGPGRWVACCPAHDDASPSLSVRETDDGRVLIYCFGGCEVEDVLDSVGLVFGDLFDKPLSHHLPPIRGGFNARELLSLISHEAFVMCFIHDFTEGAELSELAKERLALAAARISKARVLAHE